MDLSDYPDELHHLGILSLAAASVQVLGTTDGIKEDLTVISHAARELVSVAEGIVVAAKVNYQHTLKFIGFPLLGCYWKGYQRAMNDLGLTTGPVTDD